MATKQPSAKARQLHKQLHLLQANGSAVWRDMRQSNQAFYAHIAEVYYWWLAAEDIKG